MGGGIGFGGHRVHSAFIVVQAQIQSIKADYLVCKIWDGAEVIGNQFNVAKPPLLRTISSHAGVTFTGYSADGQTRTATKGADTETQILVPPYEVSDIIYPQRGIQGGTGVALADVWLDISGGGRMWITQP